VHGVGYAFEAQSSSEPASFGSEPS